MEPTIDNLINWMTTDLTPDTLKIIYQTAERRMETIVAYVEQNPDAPATMIEATVEHVLYALEDYVE